VPAFNAVEANVLEANALEANALEANALEANVLVANVLEANVLEVNVLEVNVLEVNVLEVNVLEVNVLEINGCREALAKSPARRKIFQLRGMNHLFALSEQLADIGSSFGNAALPFQALVRAPTTSYRLYSRFHPQARMVFRADEI
jgi:hypothetical protein